MSSLYIVVCKSAIGFESTLNELTIFVQNDNKAVIIAPQQAIENMMFSQSCTNPNIIIISYRVALLSLQSEGDGGTHQRLSALRRFVQKTKTPKDCNYSTIALDIFTKIKALATKTTEKSYKSIKFHQAEFASKATEYVTWLDLLKNDNYNKYYILAPEGLSNNIIQKMFSGANDEQIIANLLSVNGIFSPSTKKEKYRPFKLLKNSDSTSDAIDRMPKYMPEIQKFCKISNSVLAFKIGAQNPDVELDKIVINDHLRHSVENFMADILHTHKAVKLIYESGIIRFLRPLPEYAGRIQDWKNIPEEALIIHEEPVCAENPAIIISSENAEGIKIYVVNCATINGNYITKHEFCHRRSQNPSSEYNNITAIQDFKTLGILKVEDRASQKLLDTHCQSSSQTSKTATSDDIRNNPKKGNKKIPRIQAHTVNIPYNAAAKPSDMRNKTTHKNSECEPKGRINKTKLCYRKSLGSLRNAEKRYRSTDEFPVSISDASSKIDSIINIAHPDAQLLKSTNRECALSQEESQADASIDNSAHNSDINHREMRKLIMYLNNMRSKETESLSHRVSCIKIAQNTLANLENPSYVAPIYLPKKHGTVDEGLEACCSQYNIQTDDFATIKAQSPESSPNILIHTNPAKIGQSSKNLSSSPSLDLNDIIIEIKDDVTPNTQNNETIADQITPRHSVHDLKL